MPKQTLKPPIAKRTRHYVPFGKHKSEKRGNGIMNPAKKLLDQYFWMRSDDRSSQKVLNHLQKENKYTENVMKQHQTQTDEIFQEMKSNLQETYDSYPFPHAKWDSEWKYFIRNVEGKSYPIHCRISGDKTEILLDENEIAHGKETFDLSGFSISDDEKYMLYGTDETGNEKYNLEIVDISTRQKISHNLPEIPYCDYHFHEDVIFYTQSDSANRVCELWRYDMKSKENVMMYSNDDELISVGISCSCDQEYFFVEASSFDTSDIYYFTSDDYTMKQFTPREEGVLYDVEHHQDHFFVITNRGDCPNFKIMITPDTRTSVDNWEVFVPYNSDVFITGLFPLEHFLIMKYKYLGDIFLNVIAYKDDRYLLENMWTIEIDDPIKNISYVDVDIYDTTKIFYVHRSLNTPNTLFQYDLITRETKNLRQHPVPNYDKTLYETKRIYATSHDSKQVPMSLVYKKDMFQPGKNPLYLYGYGSYGHTVNPNFVKNMLPLINRGFVYVIAHVRGGSFLGYDWYTQGKMMTKMNTFLDFIGCAEHLVQEGYTYPKGITIEGRSAGGLLVGASMVLRPDLFNTVVAGVPFVDVLNTMSDPSIPLTTPEWEQWGNPNREDHFEYMSKYCPYRNITAQEYPNVLALAGLNDPRVQYWEPAKFVAKLRYYDKSKNNVILLKTEMNEGHFGGMDRYKYLKEYAFQHSFVLSTYFKNI